MSSIEEQTTAQRVAIKLVGLRPGDRVYQLATGRPAVVRNPAICMGSAIHLGWIQVKMEDSLCDGLIHPDDIGFR
jgi:hypothetical protein